LAEVDRVSLIGMMGSGKSTVARLLASRLGWDVLDSDAQVEARTGRTVREIFESDGEAAFRAEERRALESALSSSSPAVVAVAGGAVLDPANRQLLRDRGGRIVWLRGSPPVLAERVSAGRDHRPLLGDDAGAALQKLDDERAPVYAELADLVVDVDDKPPAAVAEEILAAMGARR
jgi:shikimate kinase